MSMLYRRSSVHLNMSAGKENIFFGVRQSRFVLTSNIRRQLPATRCAAVLGSSR